DIAIAISTAIGLSLVVSVTVIPSLSAKILKLSDQTKSKEFDQTRLGRFAHSIAELVDDLNARVARRVITISLAIGLTIGLSFLLLPDSEYLPEGDQNLIFAFMLPPPGYNLDEVLESGRHIEAQLQHLWLTPPEEADSLPGGGVGNFFFVAFPSQAFMGMIANDPSRVKELEPLANQALYSIPGVFGFARQASLFSGRFAGSRSVQLDISGPDLNQVIAIAGQAFGKLLEVLPGANARPIPGLDLGNPEVRVVPDRARAARMGINAQEIGSTINALVDGMVVTDYRHEGRDIDLLVRGSGALTRHTQDIEQLPLATPGGEIVTVADVATVSLAQGPVQINHVERQRTISIEAPLPAGIPLEEAMNRIRTEIIDNLRDQGQIGGLYDIKL
ncbi:MAG TPA: efflux RND transporter permease subunit, partial [candidate division Zixibacteria bacterium]|nr:efflux RND transporter permease subunit [candidate division Zixibacteria bacterium]